MITPLFAEMTGLEVAGLICGMAFSGGALLVSIIAVNKKQQVTLDQPLMMKMQEEFVPATRYERDHQENKREHENIFKKIGGVERGAAERMDAGFRELRTSAEDGREKIHRRLNRISIGVARLCGKLNASMPAEEEEV